jgi:hypothetical protein
MPDSYGHHITPIHANAKNICDRCDKPARWETDYKVFGEHATQSSNPEQVCDVHARAFAAQWPDAQLPAKYSR